MANVYVGRIPPRCDERDLEEFFRGYGKIDHIQLKNGYAFCEFREYRDADDAVHDLNGTELQGIRLIVEMARGTPHGRDAARMGYPVQSRGERRFRGSGQRAFERTDYRVVVENLSSRSNWQDLKDLFRTAGEVAYAEANVKERNVGLVEFYKREHMKRAVETLDGEELMGRKIRCTIVDRSRGRRSRSGSDSRSRSRSRSRDRKKRSRSRSRSSSADSTGKRGKRSDRKSDRKRSRKDTDRSSRSRSPEKEDRADDHNDSTEKREESASPPREREQNGHDDKSGEESE